MDNNQLEFVPVVAQEKSFKVKEVNERFPGKAILTLSEIKEDESRMLTLSTQAYDALGLSKKEARVGIARGYSDSAKTKEALFLFKSETESIQFVQDNKNAVKIEAARFSEGTRRAKSVKFHNIISANHSKPQDTGEKHFMLATRYGDSYWLLVECDPTANNKTIPADTNTTTTANVGETVDVTLD